MTTAAANGHRDGYQAGYADAVKAFDAAQPAAAQEAVSPTDAVCHILARAPAEYTYWEKRVWRRGVMDSTAAQEPIGYANLHHLNEKSTDGVVLRKQNEFFTVPVYAAPVTAAPVEPDLDAYDPASGELAAQWLYRNGLEKLAAVLRGQLDIRGARIRELSASTPAAQGIDLRNALLQLREDALHMKDPGDTVNAYNRVLTLLDDSPKERAFLQTVEGLEFDAPMDAVVHESPKGAVPRSDLVPGVVRCAKCSFQLARTNLYLGSGTTGPGDSKTEPCPNGCGPLWPVTWQTWATEGWQQAERYLEELRQLQAGPKGGSTDENNDLLPELRDVEDYFTSVDPNPIHLATVRQAISAIVGSPKGGSDALARAYGYLWHVNHPEDIPTGHPYMSADRAAVEARKELRDMLTHEQRGEGINCVRQKLLADMQATSAEVGE